MFCYVTGTSFEVLVKSPRYFKTKLFPSLMDFPDSLPSATPVSFLMAIMFYQAYIDVPMSKESTTICCGLDLQCMTISAKITRARRENEKNYNCLLRNLN